MRGNILARFRTKKGTWIDILRCPNGVGDDEGDVVGYDGGIVSEYSDEMGLGLEMG